MLRSTIAVCLFLTAVPAALPPAAATVRLGIVGEDKPIRALDAWLKLYRAGKIDFTSKDPITKDSLALKYGIAPKGELTWAEDLDKILAAVALLDDAAAAQALLEVAAIGIDHGKYTREMAPAEVRAAGERHAAQLRSALAKEEIGKAARGEMKVEKARAAAYRAAAARCLGLFEDRTLRAPVEALLADEAEIVRANAAGAMGKLADADSATPLIELVRRETNDAVLMTAAQSLQTIFAQFAHTEAPKPGSEASGDAAKAAEAAGLPESLRLAVHACADALCRTTWRADMELIRFLTTFRSPESVPAMIGVLERFRDHPEELKSGKLSGLLQFRVHESLVAMTGAVLPADQPDKWRQLWEAERDKIDVTAVREPKGGGATTAGDFCGIPIQGTRVVFILDLSGSMDWPMRGNDTGKKDPPTGLDFAKQELRRAIAAVAPNAQFNLVTFNGDSKSEAWNKDLVVASEKNRDRFLKFVDGLKARGGTNLWSALEETLGMKSEIYDTRYGSTLDEIFVLSDGAPSVGAVTDPIEILRLVKESNRFATTRINTVFVNTVAPKDQQQAVPKMQIQPEELMKRLAEQNGGKFENL